MMSDRRLTTLIVAWMVSPVVVGCAATRQAGKIPFGDWSGRGTFVYETWETDKDAESIHRSYSTRLSVRPLSLDGGKGVELDIVSERGELPELEGDRTHLKVALVEAKRPSDTTVLYRLADWLYNPGPGEKFKPDANAPPFAASCMTVDGTTVLQVRYIENFVDTFRFRCRYVDKTGMLFGKNGLTHWSERLQRVK